MLMSTAPRSPTSTCAAGCSRVEGVAQVVSIGGDDKQYQILVDPTRLEAIRGYRSPTWSSAIERGSRNAPGGFVVERGQESVVRVSAARRRRAISGPSPSRAEMASRFACATSPRCGSARLRRGAPRATVRSRAVLLSIVKQPEADTVSTTRRVDTALDGLGAELERQGVRVHRDVFRQQDFIDHGDREPVDACCATERCSVGARPVRFLVELSANADQRWSPSRSRL